MTLRRSIMTVACGLALSASLPAQNVCKPFMAVGTYSLTLNGWATLAATPLPVVAPVVGIGVQTIDENGGFSGPVTSVTAGSPTVDSIKGNITINMDCTVAFKATCAGGCTWEGTGYFWRNNKEITLVFTKTNGYPLTVIADLKQVSN